MTLTCCPKAFIVALPWLSLEDISISAGLPSAPTYDNSNVASNLLVVSVPAGDSASKSDFNSVRIFSAVFTSSPFVPDGGTSSFSIEVYSAVWSVPSIFTVTLYVQLYLTWYNLTVALSPST